MQERHDLVRAGCDQDRDPAQGATFVPQVITAAYQVLDQSQNAYGSVDNLASIQLHRQEQFGLRTIRRSRALRDEFL